MDRKGKVASEKSEISAETRNRIEYGLAHWNDPDSEARRRFEDAKRELDRQHQHITDAILNSERLTAEDLAFRINTIA